MEVAGSHDKTKGRVLIVEDDHDIASTMADLLRSDGFEPRVAENGEEALAKLREKPLPRVILLDLMLPVMSGWDFLETLQDERPELRKIPVIVVSAAHNPHLPDGIRLLPKPLDYQVLTDAIHQVTEH